MLDLDIQETEEILDRLDCEGHIFPQYQLYKKDGNLVLLGKGGFSCVYEAFNRQEPEKQYAIKVMGFGRHTMKSEVFNRMVDLQRMLSEQSEHVARIIDACEVAVPVSEEEQITLQFILMEKLDPVLYKDRFGKVTLASEELCTEEGVAVFAMQIGDAIETAHRNHVLHRDIKLENIFYHPQTGKYVLGDFGIAKFVENGTAETMVYTDGYGAPEIEWCLADKYSATADIYSYGVTLYLLLNDLCFPAAEGYRVNPVQYLPDFVFPAPRKAGVGFTRIVQKMCSYDSEERYESVGMVLEDIRSLGSDEKTIDVGTFYPDLETETYKESVKEKKAKLGVKRGEKTRAFRKEEKRLTEQFYERDSFFFLFGIVVFMALFLKSMGMETDSCTSPLFWLMPIALAVQAVLVKIKEFHWIFGIIAIALVVYSAISLGCNVSHVVICLAILSAMPLVMAASAIGVGLWMIWDVYKVIPDVLWIERFDVAWIFLTILLLLINGYVWQGWYYDKRSDRSVDCWDIAYKIIYHIFIVAGVIMGLLQLKGVVQMPDWWNRIHPAPVGFALKIIAAIESIVVSFRTGKMSFHNEEIIDEEEEETA